MPLGAEILDIQAQRGILCLWALVDSDTKRASRRRFRVYGTKHEIDKSANLQHLKTVQTKGFVWHIFEDTG